MSCKVGVAAFVVSVALTGSASAGDAIEFAFGGGTFVPEPLSSRAGQVYVPTSVGHGRAAPLVVFLHGLNEGGPLHKWLGAPGYDVRPAIEKLIERGQIAPVLVAAPSQTRDAARPWGMWEGFDLSAFVERAEEALGDRAHVDRERVVLVGHSGGGCNLKGGILGPGSLAGGVVPTAVVAIDTCLDRDVAMALLQAAPWTRVWAFWQTSTWTRGFFDFQRTLLSAEPRAKPLDRRAVELLPIGGDPHDQIVFDVLSRALPQLVPAVSAAP